jgi:uncharacterized protein YuzB (UPF0349 family)
MQTLTANDAIQNLDDDQTLELMKADYLKYCFNSAKEDLAKGNVIDGEEFLDAL